MICTLYYGATSYIKVCKVDKVDCYVEYKMWLIRCTDYDVM